MAEAVAAAQRVSREETAELYDGYLNDLYRSLKAWRRGNELAGRIEAGRSLRFLGELLFALDGSRGPYPKDWPGRLGELEPLMLEVARTADPTTQQELRAACARSRTSTRTCTPTGTARSTACWGSSSIEDRRSSSTSRSRSRSSYCCSSARSRACSSSRGRRSADGCSRTRSRP